MASPLLQVRELKKYFPLARSGTFPGRCPA